MSDHLRARKQRILQRFTDLCSLFHPSRQRRSLREATCDKAVDVLLRCSSRIPRPHWDQPHSTNLFATDDPEVWVIPTELPSTATCSEKIYQSPSLQIPLVHEAVSLTQESGKYPPFCPLFIGSYLSQLPYGIGLLAYVGSMDGILPLAHVDALPPSAIWSMILRLFLVLTSLKVTHMLSVNVDWEHVLLVPNVQSSESWGYAGGTWDIPTFGYSLYFTDFSPGTIHPLFQRAPPSIQRFLSELKPHIEFFVQLHTDQSMNLPSDYPLSHATVVSLLEMGRSRNWIHAPVQNEVPAFQLNPWPTLLTVSGLFDLAPLWSGGRVVSIARVLYTATDETLHAIGHLFSQMIPQSSSWSPPPRVPHDIMMDIVLGYLVVSPHLLLTLSAAQCAMGSTISHSYRFPSMDLKRLLEVPPVLPEASEPLVQLAPLTSTVLRGSIRLPMTAALARNFVAADAMNQLSDGQPISIGMRTISSFNEFIRFLGERRIPVRVVIRSRVADSLQLYELSSNGEPSSICAFISVSLCRLCHAKGAPAMHSEVVFFVDWPDAPFSFKWHYAPTGIVFVPNEEWFVPPWLGMRNLEESSDMGKVLDALECCSEYGRAIACLHLPNDGYGVVGVCNDSVGFIELLVFGRALVFPMLSYGTIPLLLTGLSPAMRHRISNLAGFPSDVGVCPFSSAMEDSTVYKRLQQCWPWEFGHEPTEGLVLAGKGIQEEASVSTYRSLQYSGRALLNMMPFS